MDDDLCVRCAKNAVPEDRMTCDPCMDEIYAERPDDDPRRARPSPPVADERLVERVARAIHVARFDTPRSAYEPWPMDDGDREYATRIARAALAASDRDALVGLLGKCREQFHQYELHHLYEAKVAGMHEYLDLEKARREKAARNREFVDMIDAALTPLAGGVE